MFVNWEARELNFKIVYFGPASSGKTTNLQVLHDRIDPRLRSELISHKTQEDRCIFFGFLQLELGQIKGLKPKFNLYTVPGYVPHEATRKLVLQGADSVIFVADSDRTRIGDNIRAFQTLLQSIQELGMDSQMLCTVQYNKRDLPDATPLYVMDRYLAPRRVPTFESVATEGVGVFETLECVVDHIVSHVPYRM